jgi:hypothetical protein
MSKNVQQIQKVVFLNCTKNGKHTSVTKKTLIYKRILL